MLFMKTQEHLNHGQEWLYVITMAEESKKRDELVVMRLISEGKNRVSDLTETLDWTRDRVEETLEDLRENEYVERVQEGGDQVLRVTDQGVKEVPKLARDVAEDTREFVDSVLGSFQKHFSKVFPKVTVDVNVEKDDE